ncbi:DUF3301 domain-containing protein [Reinekea marinisedimentorum]|uniref:Uncharacterized protein DUF3301 n=1 Tax=Reinekea marinisedimentorum TaxID=230495 RepID=A0A4R3I9K6_9GAMM|nr:DUF3301 domain-containing protein [Reinekea marinisedimentorum]TCS42072.1 uncharacterized protein DUF3301 [Reinekea marinisedimentorum]
MNLMLSDVVWFGALCIAGALWWHGQGVKSFALKKVRKYCEQHNLQLLDETLVLRRFWPVRGEQGSLALRRNYRFEFSSTGEYRYTGRIVLLGYKVSSVEVDSYHLD